MVDLQDFGRSLVENPVAPPPELSTLQRRARRLRRRQLTVAITAVGAIGLSGVALVAVRDVHRHDVTLATRPARKPSATEATEAGLQMAARSYVTAWLTNNPSGITSVRSKTCTGSTGGGTPSQIAAALTNVKSRLPDVKLSDVKVSAVQVRNFHGTTGEAEAEFDPTPGFVAGNDNWIRYAYEDGSWKVVDCTRLPFGGSSMAATRPSGVGSQQGGAAVDSSGPTLLVSPSTGLRDGQQVQVRAMGFGPSHKVFFSECANEAAINGLGCGDQLAAQVFAVTDDAGQTTTSISVHPRGFLKPYSTSASVACSDQCILVATTNLPGIGVGTARLTFVP